MKEVERIKNFGAINLTGVKTGDSQTEIHIPIDSMSGQLNGVLNECIAGYRKKYKNVKSADELCLDAQIVFSCGGFCSKKDLDYSLFVAVWQITDEITGEDTTEFYEGIPVLFGSDDVKQIKKTAWNALGVMLFNL